MDNFNIKIFLNSKKQYYTFNEIKYKTYKNIVKTILNNNNTDISELFNNLISSHCVNNDNNFNFLEKLCILLALRIICISPVLDFSVLDKNKKQQFISVDLTKLLEQLQLKNEDFTDTQTIENVKINFSSPSDFFYNTFEEHYISTIKNITVNNVTYNVNDNSALDLLPTSSLKYAKDFFNKIHDNLNDLFLLKVNFGKNEKIDLPLSLKDNTIIEFLKILFKRDLLSLYEFEYFFISKANLSFDLLYNSTPAELNVFMNIYKKDLEERNKQQQSNNLNPLTPNLNKINE